MLTMFIQPSTVEAGITAGITIRVRQAPPELPYYEQPYCPVDGYLWVPGYWGYDDKYDDYYWVPGVWVRPPHYGYLWTPGYWGYSGGYYGFHDGYWGRNVGYYGGVNYGYGYNGSGYYGGRWQGNYFQYNTAIVNVNRNIVRHTYADRTYVRNNRTGNRSSYNGPGGVRTSPNSRERVAMRQTHARPTSQQSIHQQSASKNRSQFSKVNNGRPTNTEVNRVGGRATNSRGQQQARPQQQNRQQQAPQQRQVRQQQQNRQQQQARPQQQNRQQQQQARPQQQNRQQQAPQQRQVRPQQDRQQQQARPQQQNRQQQAPQQRQQAPQQQGDRQNNGNHGR